MPKPPHFFQTYPFSCVPACIKMVLASLDFEISEPELRNLCECDETGTALSRAVKAVNECGFDAYQAELIFEELEDLISERLTPIVYLRVSETADYSHAVVVYQISKKKIFVLDPAIGEREIDKDLFEEYWLRGLTITIENKK